MKAEVARLVEEGVKARMAEEKKKEAAEKRKKEAAEKKARAEKESERIRDLEKGRKRKQAEVSLACVRTSLQLSFGSLRSSSFADSTTLLYLLPRSGPAGRDRPAGGPGVGEGWEEEGGRGEGGEEGEEGGGEGRARGEFSLVYSSSSLRVLSLLEYK
jgi:hypothetical protein